MNYYNGSKPAVSPATTTAGIRSTAAPTTPQPAAAPATPATPVANPNTIVSPTAPKPSVAQTDIKIPTFLKTIH